MSEIKLTLDVVNHSSHSDIEIELWMDNTKFFDNFISTGTHKIGHVFEEDDADHVFKVVMKNKQDHHTIVDSNNEIVDDTLIDVRNICFDDINIDTIVHQVAVYNHDTNSTSPMQEHKFYGTLGCNGEVVLEFSTPFYMWLLENM